MNAGQETPGEDPTVNANWAEDFVGGFQRLADDAGRPDVSSTTATTTTTTTTTLKVRTYVYYMVVS